MKIIDFKDSSCRHCYKCVRNCAVKAITVQNQQAHIMPEHCIHCGHCLEVCPQNAKVFASDLDKIRGYIRDGKKVIVSVAPSYLGILDFKEPGQVVGALRRLGFAQVRETAEGAALVTASYVRLMKQGTMRNIITTCCPSVNDLIEKYYPSLVSDMAPVMSPMAASGKLIRALYGEEVKTVFLGPCVAKKAEAVNDERLTGLIDAVFTFEELQEWLQEKQIRLQDCQPEPFANPDPAVNRIYPVSGGVMTSVLAGIPESTEVPYEKVHVDGLEACMELLDAMEKGEIRHCFIEANVCAGGCIKGPASTQWNRTEVMARMKIQRQTAGNLASADQILKKIDISKRFTDRHLQDPLPTETELTAILAEMGKYSSKDELNCGACGYSSCREKAKAVFQGKAEIAMCVPYALAKAESMSNVVMETTPSLIFVVDRQLKIKDCNKAAQHFLGMSHAEALESYFFEQMDEQDVTRLFETGEPVRGKRQAVKAKNRVLEETVVLMEKLDCALVVCQDITEKEADKQKQLQFRMDTVDLAQEIIDKQMHTAQEIASLLGESTAQTKVTLNRLQQEILKEET